MSTARGVTPGHVACVCRSQAQLSQHLPCHLPSACCPRWGAVLFLTPLLTRGCKVIQFRGCPVLLAPFPPIAFPPPTPTPTAPPSALVYMFSILFPAHCLHEGNRLPIFKTLNLPAPGSGPGICQACPNSIMNRERSCRLRDCLCPMQLQDTAEPQSQILVKVTGCDRGVALGDYKDWNVQVRKVSVALSTERAVIDGAQCWMKIS